MSKYSNDLKIEIKDEIEWILRHELIVTSRDEMIDLGIKYGPHIAAVAAIISRHIGIAPEDILKENKRLLMDAGAAQIYLAIRYLKSQVELETGRMISVAQYNKPPASKEDYITGEEGTDNGAKVLASESTTNAPLKENYAEAGSEQYCENAIRYLRWSLGHVRNRLAEMAASGHDFRAEAEDYTAEVMNIVEYLEREPNGG